MRSAQSGIPTIDFTALRVRVGVSCAAMPIGILLAAACTSFLQLLSSGTGNHFDIRRSPCPERFRHFALTAHSFFVNFTTNIEGGGTG